MKVLYLDCFSGAAGDMLLAALIDAGAAESAVRDALQGLDLAGWDLQLSDVQRGSLRARKVTVTTSIEPRRRNLSDITSLLAGADLDTAVRDAALATFEALGRAEARVHGVSLDEVHFHEVGAIDAIVDIVGTCAAVSDLAPDLVVCSPVVTGRGTTNSEHGPIPVPGPAVLELLAGRPVVLEGEGELLTPTGAALLATLVDRFGEPPAMQLEATGYGAGSRDTATPNVVRALVGTTEETGWSESHLLLETNLDDMAPELLPYAVERLLAAGAQDAWSSPIVMKKGRPAVTLSILVNRSDLDPVLDALYSETTTFGVRIRPTGKHELERDWVTVQIDGYDVRLKRGLHRGRVTSTSVEFEDAVKVARVTGMPLKEVYRRALEQQPDGT